MHDLQLFLKKSEIKDLVKITARKIEKKYENKEIIIIGILKGSFAFLSDLVRELKIPIKVDFAQVSSYRNEIYPQNIELVKGVSIDIENKNVLIVDDILDSGSTMRFLIKHFLKFKPKDIKICTFIKKEIKNNLKPDFFCCSIEKDFVVGYGMDYAERYRELENIYIIKF